MILLMRLALFEFSFSPTHSSLNPFHSCLRLPHPFLLGDWIKDATESIPKLPMNPDTALKSCGAHTIRRKPSKALKSNTHHPAAAPGFSSLNPSGGICGFQSHA
jgi:hypothetical protein